MSAYKIDNRLKKKKLVRVEGKMEEGVETVKLFR